MKIIKCPKTGNILKLMGERVVFDDNVLIPNSFNADSSKHIPQITVEKGVATIKVNHIMEKDHYIEWILVDYGDLEIIKYYKPFQTPVLTTNYTSEMKVYAFCNKDGLWINENK